MEGSNQQITCNVTSSEIFKYKGLFVEQKYLKMKDEKLGLRRKQYAKGEGLERKLNVFKICVNLWRHGKESNVI